MSKISCLIILLLVYSCSQAQNYCLEFSKEKKKSVTINEGKVISFILTDQEQWIKGSISKISSDSLFIEQRIPKEDVFTERENRLEIIGYALMDFKMLAYPKTSSAIRGTTVVMLLAAATVLTAGAVMNGMAFEYNEDHASSVKLFQKNIDFEDEWIAKIIRCD